jgi:hypothetical protein
LFPESGPCSPSQGGAHPEYLKTEYRKPTVLFFKKIKKGSEEFEKPTHRNFGGEEPNTLGSPIPCQVRT